MKKLLLLLAPLTLGLMVGCSYDDSAILDKIAEMEKEQDEMQKEHDEMQAQLDAQQTLLDALANKLTITAVTQTDNGNTITFSDGTSMSIKDGEQGEKGEDGDSFIESIVVGEEDVTFTLTDGTVIVIPLGSGGSSDGGEPSAEDNKIYYTTSDGKKLFPNNTEPAAFGAILVSNTYEDGHGVLTFDDTITSIGEKAFYNCSSLTTVTIPDSVTSIGDSAFYGCSSLTNSTIPDSVTSIGDNAFRDCSSLTSITIPDSVTKMGGNNRIFYGCYIAKDKFINNSSLDAAANNYWGASIYDIIQEDGLCINSTIAVDCKPDATSVTIPDSVTSIGDYAFYGCSSLTTVTIPDSVTSIGKYAFEDCTSLTSITIPESVTSIGDYAFYDCSSLTSVYCRAVTPPTVIYYYWYAFDGNASERKIYVPTESVDAYKVAWGWKDYADYIVGYDFE